MRENIVKRHLRRYLMEKGWTKIKISKNVGGHGIDISARHIRWQKTMIIETKGGSGKHKHQEVHNAFYNVLGQIVARMDIEGNHPNKSRAYAIGIPYAWFQTFKNKIAKMKYGWKLLKLRVNGYGVRSGHWTDTETYMGARKAFGVKSSLKSVKGSDCSILPPR